MKRAASPDFTDSNSWVPYWLVVSLHPCVLSTRPKLVIAGSVLAFALAMIPLSMTGRSFLPAFNEGALTVVIVTSAGTSLEQSATIALQVEKALLAHPNVKKTARRTGRGDMDEHGKAASMTEIEAKLDMKDRKLDDVMAELRKTMAGMPATITFGQPIGHRIDHMLSGTMANLAIKVYGPELFRLRSTAEEIRAAIADVPGLADLSVEQQKDIPQVRIIPDRAQMARYNLRPHIPQYRRVASCELRSRHLWKDTTSTGWWKNLDSEAQIRHTAIFTTSKPRYEVVALFETGV